MPSAHPRDCASRVLTRDSSASPHGSRFERGLHSLRCPGRPNPRPLVVTGVHESPNPGNTPAFTRLGGRFRAIRARRKRCANTQVRSAEGCADGFPVGDPSGLHGKRSRDSVHSRRRRCRSGLDAADDAATTGTDPLRPVGHAAARVRGLMFGLTHGRPAPGARPRGNHAAHAGCTLVVCCTRIRSGCSKSAPTAMSLRASRAEQKGRPYSGAPLPSGLPADYFG